MEIQSFECQICCLAFTKVGRFKQHLYSPKHRNQYYKVYPKDVFERNKRSFTPWIFFMEQTYERDSSHPVLGLSQMTLCFSSEDRKRNGFYLCHLCELKFPMTSVVQHISHVNHYSKYFAHTDPNALIFSMVPSGNDIHKSLMDNIKKEHEKTGTGILQVLHLPDKLFQECSTDNYLKVMLLLFKNTSLSNLFKERILERMTIQTYRDDSHRKHPLLGLQYIVECICRPTPHIALRRYLCALCSLPVSSSMIIRHLLSSDHIVTYLNIWHPTATLNPKEYYRKYTSDNACTLADFAKQSEELHGPKETQQFTMNSDQWLSVCYSDFKMALKRLESIGFKAVIKIEPPSSGSDKISTDIKQQSLCEPVTSGNSTLTQNIKEENEESTNEPSVTPAAPSYRFHCQNCSENFETNTLYCDHLSTCKHQENLKKTFGAVMDEQTGLCKPHFHSYKYFTEHDILCVGVSLVVTILSHQLSDEPIHLCFACETVFPTQDLKLHINSANHAVQCVMYQNPWKLPFAWKTRLDHASLKSKACMEETERGPNISIKILDVPPCLFICEAPVTYSKVMKKLGRYHPLLMNGVPRCETYSKLQDNDRFPILGRDFLVKYGQTISGWKFLCLLCEHSLSSDDYTGHVFSWDHVVAFLEKNHPGSLDLNTTNEGMLLDLAKQAARIHPVSNAQEIEFDSSHHESDLTDYSTSVRLLEAEKARDGKGPLVPSITSQTKLFPRHQTQEANLDTKPINAVTDETVEKHVDGFQSADQESQVQINEPIEISAQDKDNLPTKQEFKEEKDPLNPSEPNQLVDIKSATSSSSDFKSTLKTTSKRQRSLSDMDTSDSEMENQKAKRKYPSSSGEKEEMSNPQNVGKTKPCSSSDLAFGNSGPGYGSELQAHIQKKIRAPLIGLSAIYECVCNDRAPIYLCKCCRLKFKEQYISRHLSDTQHYNTYLDMAGEQPLPQGKSWEDDMAKLAAYWERKEGYGEVQVVKVTQEDYENLDSGCEYNEAFKIVNKYLAKTVCSTALHENFAKTVTINRQETSQQDIPMETDPEPIATLSNNKLQSKGEITSESLKDTSLTRIPDFEQSASAMTADSISHHLPRIVTITSKAKDGSKSNNIVEDTSLKMENATHTGAPKSNKPVCKFITTKAVIPEVDTKPDTINLENIIDKIQYTPFSNSTIPGTLKPTTKPVCTFKTAKSATRNVSSSNTRQSTSPMLVDKVPDCAHIAATNVSNATKEAPNPDTAVLPDAVRKRKADYAVSSEPSSKVRMQGNNNLPAKKTTTESFSSQAKLLSDVPATSTPKTSDAHAKSTGIQLKLNVNAASQVKNDVSVCKTGRLTPTTPNACVPTPTAETFQKDPNQSPHIGLDQLVKVKCKEKRLSYCFACLAILEATNHMTSTTHQINCVKMKFPWWSAKDEELRKMVALLHDDEKASNVKVKCIEVSFEVYKELKALPDEKAIEKVRDMIKRKSSNKLGQRRQSTSTSEASNSQCDISTSPNILASPCEATSSNLGKEDCQTNPQKKSCAQAIKKIPPSTKCSPSSSPPVQKPTSKVAPRIIKGSTTDDLSNLSRILSVKDTSVIGLCLVWECRVVPPKHPTFYLCESCSLTILTTNDICDHMESTEHHLKYLMRQYPQFMFWLEEKLPPRMANDMTDLIAGVLKAREKSLDAQTVLLSEECFEWVRSAPFVEALNVVHRIKEEKKITTLPLIVPSQQEGELREQPRTQPTLDTFITLTDLPNQKEISVMENADEIMDTQHETPSDGNIASGNSETCTSPTETNSMPSPETAEILHSQHFTSLYSPKSPDEPALSMYDQNLAASPNVENQEHFEPETKACSHITSPLSHIITVMSPIVDTAEATSLATLKETSTYTTPKADIRLGSPSAQETSTVSPSPSEDSVTESIEEDQMESSPHGHSDTNESTSLMASSPVDHNANENPPLNPAADYKAALDKHFCLLLINLLKQTKQSMQQATSTKNQTSDPCTVKLLRKNVEPCETDTDVAAKGDNIVTENKAGPSGELSCKSSTLATDISNKNTACVNLTTVSSDDLKEKIISERTTQQSQGQFVQSKDDKTVEKSKIQEHLQLSEIQTQQKEIKINKAKMENKYNSAVHSKIQQSQCQASQQKQELQLKPETQEASSKRPPHMPPGLMKHVQSDSGAVQLLPQQTQVQTLQQAQNQELQLQSQLRAQSQNATQQTQGQKVQEQSNIAEVQSHIHHSQQQTQNQVPQFQLQPQVAPAQNVALQTQDPTEQIPINSLITPRPHNTMYFRNDTDNRQNFPVTNTGFQVSQGPPQSTTVTPPVTSSTMEVTGEYRHFVQTAHVAKADYSNTQVYGVPHGSTYPSHVYQPLQTQHYYPSVQPFLPHVQHSEVSRWINPNPQLQPVIQNYSAWSNQAVVGTSNVHYSNTVSFNTVSNQSYIYSYNNLQEYNNVLVQNLFYTPSSAPPQNSQFFPHRQ